MNDRLHQLEKLLEREPDDPFLLYGMAQELARTGRHDEALGWYDRCLQADPAYCYAFYHRAVSQIELDDRDGARATLERGLEVARSAADGKAFSEIQGLLDTL